MAARKTKKAPPSAASRELDARRLASAKRFDVSKIKVDQIARSGGPPTSEE